MSNCSDHGAVLGEIRKQAENRLLGWGWGRGQGCYQAAVGSDEAGKCVTKAGSRVKHQNHGLGHPIFVQRGAGWRVQAVVSNINK